MDHLRYSTQGFLHDETRKQYPIGRNTWIFDDRLCEINEKPTNLTLTSCGEDEFTCTGNPWNLQCIYNINSCCNCNHNFENREFFNLRHFEKHVFHCHRIQRLDEKYLFYTICRLL